MGLRDQLLQAGLVSKKQAKKAANSVRVENKKSKKTDVQSEKERLQCEIKNQAEERKNRDRELNAQKEQQRQEKERYYQAKELIVTRDLKDHSASIAYRFIENKKYIRTILVTENQQQLLAEGRLGIAVLGDPSAGYFLLDLQDALKVKSVNEEMLICLHPLEAVG